MYVKYINYNAWRDAVWVWEDRSFIHMHASPAIAPSALHKQKTTKTANLAKVCT
jgi:hypothetical protein